jgi:hypothetical protein
MYVDVLSETLKNSSLTDGGSYYSSQGFWELIGISKHWLIPGLQGDNLVNP